MPEPDVAPRRWRQLPPERLREILAQPDAASFRYTTDSVGMTFLFMAGCVGLFLVFVVWWMTGFASDRAVAWVVLPLTLVAWAAVTFARWTLFAVRTYIVISSEVLLLGRGRRADEIPAALLNRESIRMEEMKITPAQSVLPLRVGGMRYDIHLLGPFAKLKEHRTFLALLLGHLVEQSEGSPREDEGYEEDVTTASEA